MAETFRTGDLVMVEVVSGYWIQGVVDYVYETNGDLVIRVGSGPDVAVFERHATDVRRA
jgi:hypothetical protein